MAESSTQYRLTDTMHTEGEEIIVDGSLADLAAYVEGMTESTLEGDDRIEGFNAALCVIGGELDTAHQFLNDVGINITEIDLINRHRS